MLFDQRIGECRVGTFAAALDGVKALGVQVVKSDGVASRRQGLLRDLRDGMAQAG